MQNCTHFLFYSFFLGSNWSKWFFTKHFFIFFHQKKNKKVFWGYGYDYDAYFAKDLLRLSDCETFVDGGAFDGDTVGNFLKITKNKYNKDFTLYYTYQEIMLKKDIVTILGS